MRLRATPPPPTGRGLSPPMRRTFGFSAKSSLPPSLRPSPIARSPASGTGCTVRCRRATGARDGLRYARGARRWPGQAPRPAGAAQGCAVELAGSRAQHAARSRRCAVSSCEEPARLTEGGAAHFGAQSGMTKYWSAQFTDSDGCRHDRKQKRGQSKSRSKE